MLTNARSNQYDNYITSTAVVLKLNAANYIHLLILKINCIKDQVIVRGYRILCYSIEPHIVATIPEVIELVVSFNRNFMIKLKLKHTQKLLLSLMLICEG